MNEESNTTTIIVVLLVLGLLVIGTVFLTRFIVCRISRALSRQPSQRRASRTEAKKHQGTPKNVPGFTHKEPSLSPETSPRERPAPKTHSPEPPPVVRRSPPKSRPQEPPLPPKESIPRTTRETTTKRRVKSGWIPKGGSAYVAGREIGGMIYVGRGPRAGRYSQPDNAFIDPSKSVPSRGGDYEGQGMDYWPNYSTIDARSRATYLDWLSSGRSDARYSVGYVFIYFYGLERRVFVDKMEPQERADIIAEVRRLLEIYGDNHSIRRYLGAFVDTTSLLGPSGDPQPIFEYDGYDVPANVLLALGSMASRNVPLTSDWLLSWFICSPETKLRTPAKRAFAEFKAYFQHLFDREYPDGLKIRTPRRRLKLKYHAASGNFATDLNEYLGDIPDVSSLSAPLRIAQRIDDTSADGLDKYSRYLGRNPDGRGSIEAHALLPEALWPLFPCPEKEELQIWATKQIESGGLVPVEDVVERLEGARPEPIGKRQLIGVADALARLGVGMAPDPRFALRKPQAGEPVVLFRLPKDTLTIESPTDAYRSAILNLAVATLVAHADGQIDHAERAHMAGQIDANQLVTEAERARLHANLSWMIAVPPDMSMLRSRLRNAPEDIRSALGQLAVVAAGVDSAIDPEEIRVIERLYAVMGLERDRVYTDLHALTSAPEPVTVRPADRATREFAIPSPPPETPADAMILDTARVSAVMADTARVSRVLGDIFSDGDDEDEESVEETVSEADDEFSGLDAPHRAVVSVLITRHQWIKDEIAALADEHQLMAAGALETINEWAFDKFDDALIEEYDGYEINGDIAQQLMR